MSLFIRSNVIDFDLACPDNRAERLLRLNALNLKSNNVYASVDGGDFNHKMSKKGDSHQNDEASYTQKQQHKKKEREEMRAQLAAEIKAINNL